MKVNDFAVKALKEEFELMKKFSKQFPDSLEVKGRLGGIAYALYMLDLITDEEKHEIHNPA